MHHAAVADELCHFHRGDVQRVRERVAHGNAAHEPFAIIVGRVWFAVEFERRGLVVDRGCRRDNRLHVIDGVVERRCIDKWLEDRARLAMSEGVIQLALSVIPSADDGFDFSAPRIECYEGHLRLGNRLIAPLLRQLLLPLVVSFGQQCIDVLHARFDRRHRRALQRRVQRRVYAEVFAQQLVFRVLVQQVVFHHVDEIRRLSSRRRGMHNVHRLFLRLFHVLCGDVFVLEHLRQHAIAGLPAALGVAVSG